jgi:putative FmdB family regulatory protein
VTLPLYEYKCVKCQRVTEKIEKVSGPHLKKCPHCGGKVEQLVSRSAIQFKGAGWYVTDYAGKKPAVDGGSGSAATGAEKSENKEATAKESSSKESKESKEIKESKPSAEKKTEKKKS